MNYCLEYQALFNDINVLTSLRKKVKLRITGSIINILNIAHQGMAGDVEKLMGAVNLMDMAKNISHVHGLYSTPLHQILDTPLLRL